MQQLRVLAGWAGAALFLWLAVRFATDGHSPAGAALALVTGAVLSPPFRNRVRSLTAVGATAALLFALQVWAVSNDAARHAAREQAAAERDSMAKARTARADLEAAFEKGKVDILRGIAASAAAGRYREALIDASRYPTNDPDLSNLRRSIEADMLRQEAQSDIPADRRAVVFARLAELEPSNADYREKAKQYGAESATLRAALDRLNRGHCPDAGYDHPGTLTAFMREHGTAPSLAKQIDDTGPFVGLSEPLFLAWFCPLVETVNETEATAGTSRQYVMTRHIAGRYVYTRGGIVTAVQR